MNLPIDSFVGRQQLNHYLPIFPDTCGPSREDMIIKSPPKDNNRHSAPNFLVNSVDCGIAQSSPHLTLHFNWNHQSLLVSRLHLALCFALLLKILIPLNRRVLELLHAQETQELYKIFLSNGTKKHTSEFSPMFLRNYFPTSFSNNKRTQKNSPSLSKKIQGTSTHSCCL